MGLSQAGPDASGALAPTTLPSPPEMLLSTLGDQRGLAFSPLCGSSSELGVPVRVGCTGCPTGVEAQISNSKTQMLLDTLRGVYTCNEHPLFLTVTVSRGPFHRDFEKLCKPIHGAQIQDCLPAGNSYPHHPRDEDHFQSPALLYTLAPKVYSSQRAASCLVPSALTAAGLLPSSATCTGRMDRQPGLCQ